MYKVVDLFAGAGGLSLGFMQTRKYDIKVAFENSPYMQETYRLNHPGVEVHGDVCAANYDEIKEKYGGYPRRAGSTITCMRIDAPSALMLPACPARLYASGYATLRRGRLRSLRAGSRVCNRVCKERHMTVEKKDIDWGSLGFGYMKTDYSYEAHWKDGEWDEGGLTTDHTLHVSECGGIFHYCQEVFEGLKAYTAEDGSIVCFRPDMNAERMYNSAQRLEMPPFPKDKFVEAVKQVVSANAAWVPPFGSGATLYVRPFMIGSGDVIGVAPAPEYTFRILVTPVGPYFKGGLKPVKLRVSEYDRAAPHGTGNIKAGLNYAMSLKPTMEAHREGYAENLYLDSESRTYVEETGGANVLFVKEDGTLVVPQSHTDSILPSITRRSLVQVAEDLGMTVDQRPVEWAEVKAGTFVECGLCGTAAVISPVGEIDNKVYGADETVTFPAGYTEIGPVMKKLRETLTGIQSGAVEDKHNWVYTVA